MKERVAFAVWIGMYVWKSGELTTDYTDISVKEVKKFAITSKPTEEGKKIAERFNMDTADLLYFVEEGKNYGLSHCGSHAMDIMRMESGFLHWGHDISPEENQYEAGLNFTISYKKEINFVGKESLIKLKDKKQSRRFIMLSLKEGKPGTPLLLHEEPIYLGDKIIGRTTSGNYSFNYKKNLSFGYVSSAHSNEELSKMDIYIEVAKRKYQAKVEDIPLKDKKARFL